MSEYTPDVWVMVEIVSPEHGIVNKLLCGWYGGYLYGDSWKLSSGNLQEHMEGDFIVFPQESGSVYRCHKDSQRFSGLTGSIFASYAKKLDDLGNGSSMKVIEHNCDK